MHVGGVGEVLVRDGHVQVAAAEDGDPDVEGRLAAGSGIAFLFMFDDGN